MSLEQQIQRIRENDPTLTSLDLTSQALTDSDFQNLSLALAQNTHLKSLELAKTNPSNAGLSYLSTALKSNNSLESLNLGGNELQQKGLEYLCEVLRVNQSLRTLELHLGNSGYPEQELFLSALLDNYSLQDLYINYNGALKPGFLISVIKNGERNKARAANPKPAFDDNFFFKSPTSSEHYVLEHKIETIGRLLSGIFVIGFPIAGTRKNEQRQIDHNRFAGFSELVKSLSPAEIDLLFQIVTKVRLNDLYLIDFVNCLFDRHLGKLKNLAGNLYREFAPQASSLLIKEAVSRFIEGFYHKIVSGYPEILIRTWLVQYRDPETELPSSDTARQQLLEKALREAAAIGDSHSVRLLTHYVKQVNKVHSSGITPLDYALSYARGPENDSCVQLLRQAGAIALDLKGKKPLSVEELDLDSNKQLLSVTFKQVLGKILSSTLLALNTEPIVSMPDKEVSEINDYHINECLLELANELNEETIRELQSLSADKDCATKIISYLCTHYHTTLEQCIRALCKNAEPTASEDLVNSSVAKAMTLITEKQKIEEGTRIQTESDKLIRVWVKAYRSIMSPIPAEEEKRQELYVLALSGAIHAGAANDIQKLIGLVKDLNTPIGPLRRTVLHHAVIYANESADSNPFFLLIQKGASWDFKDKQGQTPVDLWDLENNPDPVVSNLMLNNGPSYHTCIKP
ncbi:Ankyrin repeats (3 copies) [Legionella quinlivanii]|uniref:Ankyrin repeats (3 copies) n=1 Tax=Legionella quinlivanii TaxID=45073 RepID=A0A0W0XLJ5_9GAMM|nr:hypothetical protein [Legionella quinlivanii]KTD45452.1 Ankyrin repeats (3 copies) [Legionella quinlivanii]MCW8451260.1 hypothetical protein [Legionella quinlivanii]SEG33331.1 hypothetical protein SAMN02746093_02563 [Legionella quinlivanii DSM 21216]STY10543.1 Ran GTPase-activating protein (RanGAP) involved in mRNA processing and transport [Legionella quinlivanii]